MLSSSAVANPSSLAVSETWERKAVTKTQEWWGRAWQLSGCSLPLPQLYLTVNINILTEIIGVKSADRQHIKKPSQNMVWKRSTQASISSNQNMAKEETSVDYRKKGEGHMPPRSMIMRSTHLTFVLGSNPSKVNWPRMSYDLCLSPV